MTPLAITPGDPGGIGPDLCIQAAADGELNGVVVADPQLIKRRADTLGLSVKIMDADHYNPERTQGIIYVEPVATADPTNMPGVWIQLTPDTACNHLSMRLKESTKEISERL